MHSNNASCAPGGEHLVDFFENDDELATAVSSFLAPALVEGAGSIVIATPDHQAAFRLALADLGIDVAEAELTDQLYMVDAEETLSRILDGSAIDPLAFDATVGDLVRVASDRGQGRPVWAYGEMVALLWDSGRISEAMELETLWNDLQRQLPLTLMCGYAAHAFRDRPAADSFLDVCELHSGVHGGAPTPPGADASRRFPWSPTTPRLTRRFVADTLSAWGLDDLLDNATLVATELTTNAVVHARSDIVVGLVKKIGGVRIVVADRRAVPPHQNEADAETPNGRGLLLVDAIAHHWGHEPLDGGKHVWADVTL